MINLEQPGGRGRGGGGGDGAGVGEGKGRVDGGCKEGSVDKRCTLVGCEQQGVGG